MMLDSQWEVKGYYSGFWEFSRSMELNMELQGVTPWIPAEVPGSIHWDLYKAGILPDPYFDCNSLACEWVNDRDWLYRTIFVAEPDWQGRNVRLVCEGIDYSAKIVLNGKHIYAHEGMFLPAVIDITDQLKWGEGETNTLIIAVAKSPDGEAQLGSTQNVSHLKSRFVYKWDFAPRLVHVGLWKSVLLWLTDNHRFDDVHVIAEIDDSGCSATVHIEAILENDTGGEVVVSAKLFESSGRELVKEERTILVRPGLQPVTLKMTVEHPELWWPNGYGTQSLYRLEMHLLTVSAGESIVNVSDERQVNFGIRQVAYKQNQGAPADSLPFTVQVNRKDIYLKGWNWVPIDQLYGRNREDQYERLIRLAKDAQVNLLRVWGGGLIERAIFYDLCDRNGIMVWQEMMQSSSGFDNEPSTDPAFLYELQANMREAIREKRNHPSLIIWCGGNELSVGGHLDERMYPLTDRHPNARMLRNLVADLDPSRLFLPSSPSGPMFFLEKHTSGKRLSYDVHGPWKYAGAEKHYELYNASDALLHSEFGGDGFASIASLRKFLPENKCDSQQSGSMSWIHHGYEYWNMDNQLRELFGDIHDMDQLSQAAQWLQAEGIRYALEANRRRAPYCSGSILWQMNEPFPNVSCTSAIDYYGDPKLAYSWTAKANRSVHVSMKYDKLFYRPGEPFVGAVFITSDHTLPENLIVEWLLRDEAGTILKHNQQKLLGTACEPTLQADKIEWPVSEESSTFYVTLALRAMEHNQILASNEYAFAILMGEGIPPLSSFLTQAATCVIVEQDLTCGKIWLNNTGANVALWVRPEGMIQGNAVPVRPLEDGFLLFPGEKREIRLEQVPDDITWEIKGLNVNRFNCE